MKHFTLILLLLGCMFIQPNLYAFRVYPTSAQSEFMLDKANYPFIAENADGINLQHDSFGPFSAGQVETIFNQLTNKNFINHGVYKESIAITSMSTMTKKPSNANVTAMMLYNEAPAMDSIEWASALAQNAPWPLITHCRAFGQASTYDEIKRQIRISSGCMLEFQVTDPGKFDDAAELTKYCVDNNRMVVFLTTFQRTPDIFISAYKEFFYYLKENLDPKYLNSDYVIFVPNTYNDGEVLPETIGYGSTFGVAHWLIDQKTKINDGYIQPKITFTSPHDADYFPNNKNLTVQLNVTNTVAVTGVKLYLNNVLVGEDTEAPYSWSGGILNNLTSGYQDLKAVLTDANNIETTKAIQITILKDAPTVPGFFKAAQVSAYQLRNDPLPNGEIRHVYGKEWVDYEVNVLHTGVYDVDVSIGIQRSKQYGGTVIIKKGAVELGSFTTILNDPDQSALPGFTETPNAIIKNVPLTAGLQTLRVTFSHPLGIIAPQFRLNDFNFMIQGAPDIVFTTPTKNAVNAYPDYDAPANIEIAANITSPRVGGEIKSASLYIKNSLVKTLTQAPFVWNNTHQESALKNLQAGKYTMKIVATDELGYTSFKEIQLTVIARRPYNPNLKIPGVVKAWEFDLGGEGVAYHDFNEGLERGLGGVDNPRYAIAGNEDVEIEISAGDYCVSGIRRNEWLSYTISNVQKGTYDVILTTAANTGKSADVKVWLNGSLLTSVHTVQTGSAFTVFKEFKVSGVEIPEDLENANIRLEFINNAISTYLCFFRKFEFKKLVVDGAPSVALVRPTKDTTLQIGYTNFSVAANANVANGFSIADVTLYIDNTLKVLKDSEAPYEWSSADLAGLNEGLHTLKVTATSSTGATTSQSVNITVGKSQSPIQMSMIKPFSGDTIVKEGYKIDVDVAATSQAGAITEVTLFIDGAEIRTEKVIPYTWGHATSPNPEELNGLGVGEHEIKFVGKDDKGNIGETSFTLTVEWPNGLKNVNEKALFSIFPNPATSQFTIQLNNIAQADVFVYSLTGELMFQKNAVTDGFTIRKSQLLNAGTYLISIHTKEYGVVTQKLIMY